MRRSVAKWNAAFMWQKGCQKKFVLRPSGQPEQKQIGQAARAVSKVPSASMRNNSFMALLVGLLFVSAMAAPVQVLRLSFAMRDLRRIQPKLLENSGHLNLTQALIND